MKLIEGLPLRKDSETRQCFKRVLVNQAGKRLSLPAPQKGGGVIGRPTPEWSRGSPPQNTHPERIVEGSHMETLKIYKLSSRKFTTQNYLY